MINDDEIQENVGGVLSLAAMTMPNVYRTRPKPGFLGKVFGGIAALARRGRPGAAEREITYRGPNPPTALSRFAQAYGTVRSSDLDWATLDSMRKSAQVKLGLVVRAAPVISAIREARVTCTDPAIAEFIKVVLLDSNIIMELALSSILPAYQFGNAPHEKVFETRDVFAQYTDENGNLQTAWDGPAVVYKKIKFVHPRSLRRYEVTGKEESFNGFTQRGQTEASDRYVPEWKAFVFTNREIYGGFWGESELEDAFPFWYGAEFFRALQSDYLRFKTVPPIIGHAPVGTSEVDGEEMDNMAYAASVLEQAFQHLVVILPWEVDETTRQNKWGYSEMTLSDRADMFAKAIEDLDTMVLRALLVPERTVTQDRVAVGTYNQAEIHAARLVDMTKSDTDRMIQHINKYIIPQLVEDHFGPEAPPCMLSARTLSEDLITKLYNVVITMLQNDRDGRAKARIDLESLLRQLNIPFTTGEDGIPDLPVDQNPDQGQDSGVDESQN